MYLRNALITSFWVSVTINVWFSNFSAHENHLQGSLKHGLLGLTLTISDSLGLELGPRLCICNRFPGVADAPGPGTTL